MKVDFVLRKAGREPAKVFELGKAPLTRMALFVQRLVVGPLGFAVGLGRDHRFRSAACNVWRNGSGVLACIGQHGLRFLPAPQRNGLPTVSGLSRGDQEVRRRAELLAQPVNCGRERSAGTPPA